MICITCGVNEAVNDFYKECEGCIIDEEGHTPFYQERSLYKLDDNLGWVKNK